MTGAEEPPVIKHGLVALGGSIPTRLTLGNCLVKILKRCGQGIPPKLQLLHGHEMLMRLSSTREQDLHRDPAALPTESASDGLQKKGRHPVVLKCVSILIKELPG